MKQLNHEFLTQSAFNLIDPLNLIPHTFYYAKQADGTFVIYHVNHNKEVKQHAMGLSQAAMEQFLTDNNFAKLSDIQAAVAGLATDASVQNALTAANNAQTTADQAVTDAADAQTTADQAVTDAADAQTTADNAAAAAAAAQADVDALEAQVATYLELALKGTRGLFTEIGSAAAKITATTEEGTYALVVTSTDPATTETVTVNGIDYVLNSSSTLYFSVDAAGAIYDVTLDDNSVYALVTNLQADVSKFTDLAKDLAKREHNKTYDIAQFGGEQSMLELFTGALGNLSRIFQSAPYYGVSTFRTAFTFKGAGTCNVTGFVAESGNGNPETITVSSGDMIVAEITHQGGDVWVVSQSGQYFPAPTIPAGSLDRMQYTETYWYGAAETTNPGALLSSFENKLGVPTGPVTQKIINVIFACNNPNVSDGVTLIHNPDADPADQISELLGRRSVISFQANYSVDNEAWEYQVSSLKVDNTITVGVTNSNDF